MFGLACAVLVPASVSFLVLAAPLGLYFAFAVSWMAAVLGWIPVLAPFLPLVLWHLPRNEHPLATCLIAGAISGPLLLGCLSLLFVDAASLDYRMFVIYAATMGALGGSVFWFVAVRHQLRDAGSHSPVDDYPR